MPGAHARVPPCCTVTCKFIGSLQIVTMSTNIFPAWLRRSTRNHCWLRAALAFALAVTFASAGFAQISKVPGERPVPLANAGFEQALTGNAERPADWFKAGPSETFTRDSKVFRSGAASLSLKRGVGTPFTAIAQTIPAGSLHNSVVALRAWVRSEAADATGALLLVAMGADGKPVAYAQSGLFRDSDSGEWVQHETRLLVPVTAQRLQLGLRLAGGGIRWFDDIEAVAWAVDAADSKLLSPIAEKYLDDALDAIREQALRSDRIDWRAAAAEARALAAGAVATGDTYAAIRYVLRLLNDSHSFLQSPSDREAAERTVSKSVSGVTLTTVRGRPLLSLPGFASMDPEAEQQFASRIQRAIASADKPECGLLLDLRGNSGGNMFPMLAGLAPLFADGEVGGLLTMRPDPVAWKFERGRFVSSGAGQSRRAVGVAEPVARVGDGTTPVAVLLGPATGSSGEAVAIAFIGRPHSRSFGAPTAGLTTGNRPVRLADGAVLAITASVMQDRSGRQYGGKLTPDESIAMAASASPAEDAAVAAAIAWLDRQNACPSQ